MNPRVLLVTNDYPPSQGGIQRYLVDLVASYPGEMSVAVPADPVGVPTPGVFPGPGAFMWPSTGTRRWLTGVIGEVRPDLVLFGAPHPLAFLGPRLGLPYAVLAHGAEVSVARLIPVYGSLMVRALRGAKAVFAVSEHTARVVRRAARIDPLVVGAGVRLERFRTAAPSDGVVITCVSRFVPRKGHVRVIAAGEELVRRGHDVRIVLAGSGRLHRRLVQRAAGAAVPVVVVDRPTDAAVVGLLNESSIFCMPATDRWFGLEREGLGIVYLEAAASSLPVLAGPSGGAPETIVPGKTGYVVESVADIVEAVELLADPDRRRAVGAAGRRLVEERFTWPSVASQMAETFRQIV